VPRRRRQKEEPKTQDTAEQAQTAPTTPSTVPRIETRLEALLELPKVREDTIERLRSAGYTNLVAIAFATAQEIASSTGIPLDVANAIVRFAWERAGFTWTTAKYVKETKRFIKKITTGSKNLDRLLGGGVETKTITEFYGEYGTGKTQLCHQLAVNVQLPEDRGGLGKGAVYLDTEGTFRWERIDQMARALGLDPEKVMENIHYVRIASSDHQMAMADELFEKIPEWDVGLVIVDSVTGHFRAEYPGRENLAVRQQKLGRHLRQLMKLAEAYDIAVVVTNQVMARPDVYGYYGEIVEAIGGHVLAHAPGVRVFLRKSRGNKRIAKVVDAPHLPEGETVFVITEEGIRDPEK